MDKICIICGTDVSDLPRVRDDQERYYCEDRYNQAQEPSNVTQQNGPAASTGVEAEEVSTSEPIRAQIVASSGKAVATGLGTNAERVEWKLLIWKGILSASITGFILSFSLSSIPMYRRFNG